MKTTTPKLSTTSFYPKPEKTFKQTFSTPGSTLGIALIGTILLYLSWRYQRYAYKKVYQTDDIDSAWSHRDKLLDMQRQQEANLKDMELYYYYNNLHPQQKINQILRQNNANELESFVDESIIERASKPRYII